MNKRILFSLGLVIMFAYIVFLFIKESKESELLKNAVFTKAIITEKHDGKGVHQTAYGKFRYRVDDKTMTFSESGNFMFLQIGDTILIKYAKEDPSVATVVDRYYMKKYKDLKN